MLPPRSHGVTGTGIFEEDYPQRQYLDKISGFFLGREDEKFTGFSRRDPGTLFRDSKKKLKVKNYIFTFLINNCALEYSMFVFWGILGNQRTNKQN